VCGERWVMAYEADGTGRKCVTAAARIAIGQRLDVGREGDLPLGVEVPSTLVSRRTMTVAAIDSGWQITLTNRNGGVLHSWGQAPELAAAKSIISWPLVAIRTLPDTDASQHWVLLEADDLPITPAGPIAGRADSTQTERAARPGELPPAEREALFTMFEALLRWPPHQPARPLLLKQAATRLGISISGMQDRLTSARNRASQLGLYHPVGLTDPSYLYVLVRAGYLPAPRDFPHRPPPR
jgi:hypothetical protein